MKIYTKKGDFGKTKLFGGKQIYKDNLRVEAYGEVDELNTWLGLLADHQENPDHKAFIIRIQHQLFVIGSVLASSPDIVIKDLNINEESVHRLEKEIDQIQNTIPELREFIIPGGHISVSLCHLARTVCRRVERKVVSLSKKESVDALILKFLNRLSDYLFVLARKMCFDLGIAEIKWDKEQLC